MTGAWRQLFWYSLDCKAVATFRIPETYKPKPNPYFNTNPNPNPTSILSKFFRKNFTLLTEWFHWLGMAKIPCIQSKVYQNTLRVHGSYTGRCGRCGRCVVYTDRKQNAKSVGLQRNEYRSCVQFYFRHLTIHLNCQIKNLCFHLCLLPSRALRRILKVDSVYTSGIQFIPRVQQYAYY